MALTIGVPRETLAGERRVATVPEVVEKLVKLGFSVAVESGAGDAANFADDTYRAVGAEVVATPAEVRREAIEVLLEQPSGLRAHGLRVGKAAATAGNISSTTIAT